MWFWLFDNPSDRLMRLDRKRAIAYRALTGAGWRLDDGILRGDGMYKIVDGVLLYVTNLEYGPPQAGAPVLLGFYVQNADGEWEDDEDSEQEEFPTVSALIARTTF